MGACIQFNSSAILNICYEKSLSLGIFNFLWQTIPHQTSRISCVKLEIFCPRLRWDKTAVDDLKSIVVFVIKDDFTCTFL